MNVGKTAAPAADQFHRISTCTYLQAVQQEAAPCLHFIREATTRDFIRMVFKAQFTLVSTAAERGSSSQPSLAPPFPCWCAMAEEEGQEVIFTENTAPDREIWDEKGGLIKKGAAEIAERDQDHVPEVKVLTTLGMFAVPVTAETTIGEIRQKVQEWKPEYSLEQIELVCKDKDAWGPLFNKTSRPRDDDETVESLWSDWDIPRRMMQVALWIKEKNEETGEWESTFWKMLEESKCDDMDCGSIRSSVVDWTRLQQSAADFNRAWALNAPPNLQEHTEMIGTIGSGVRMISAKLVSVVEQYVRAVFVGRVLQLPVVASDECPLGSLTAAVLALVCSSDCGTASTREAELVEMFWRRALQASQLNGFGEVPSSEGAPWLLGTSAWPVAGLLAKWSSNCTRRSSLRQHVPASGRCASAKLNEFIAEIHVAADRTLAALLPGSGSASLIFDSRLDFYAMAALPALRRLHEALPELRSSRQEAWTGQQDPCTTEVATKEVLLLFLRLLGPTVHPGTDPLHPARTASLAKTLATVRLQRLLEKGWPLLAMLAASGLTTWRSHGLYPSAQVKVSDVEAVVSTAAIQDPGATDVLEAVATQRSLQRNLWQKTSSSDVSPILRQIATWLLEAPDDVPQVVFMTMFFGDLGNATWVARFLDRALVVGLPRLIFVSPDQEYLDDCADVAQVWKDRGDAYSRLLCFRSLSTVVRPYDINNYAKFVLLPLLLALGMSYAWLDVDIFVAQNPTQRLVDLAQEADVLTTDHFDETCLNHGVIYVKASDRTLMWVLSYIRWMHVYPFGHDQNGWDAFLGHSIKFEPSVPAKVNANITLRVLDTGKEFLTLTGWAGEDADLPAALLLHLTRTTPIGVMEKRTRFFELMDSTLASSGSSSDERRRDLEVLRRTLIPLRASQPSPKRSCYEGIHVAVEQAVTDGSYWHLFE
ncbi:hypothetical protein AK812_SmicGene18274 [Symbiodinium microadriaticum]|uniref:Nucleotide-diphospho-sugar transferase domain-containing protein n=10 Tax=Alveolata TaxID=33630 RepID=A0A1Q9DVI1_SYMMI|nr:hypothetical protein AK812_SmicGene18274 [Symbiodinium microadriaticum]